MADDDPISPTDPPAPNPSARRRAPDDVWTQVRDAYLSGISAPACCLRFGVSLSSLRSRASREGWRRSDMPWMPLSRLDPEDEGVKLEEEIAGDIDMLQPYMLSHVAERRMMRAVLRGDAAEVMRWHRVRQAMEALQNEEDLNTARDDAMRARLFPNGVADLHELDESDGVFGSSEEEEGSNPPET